MNNFYTRYWQDKHIKVNSFDHTPYWNNLALSEVLSFFGKYLTSQNIVLDFGCGRGILTREIKPYCKAIYGVDILPLTKKEEIDYNIDFMTIENGILPFDSGYFDAVFAIDVLEHILDIETTLEEINRVLAPGGLLFISTSLLTRLKLIGIALFFMDRYFYPTSPHIRYFTKYNLKDILERKEFEVIEQKSYGLISGQFVVARKVNYINSLKGRIKI